jgi:hypothetical protein
MNNESATSAICLIGLFGMVFGVLLIAYEDGVPMNRWRKLRCGIGWHKMAIRYGGAKIHKFYCQFCRKPRKHPPLKVIDGGNKFKDNKYTF